MLCCFLIGFSLGKVEQAFAGIKPPVPRNGYYIGMFLGGTMASNQEAMAGFNAKAGKRHAIFHRFVEVNTGEDWTSRATHSIAQFMRDCAIVGAMPMLTLEPANKLEDDDDGLKAGDRAWLEQIATHVGEYGFPTFIRFAHEMNLKQNDNKWIDAVYDVSNLTERYPNLRAVVWFGEDKKPDPNSPPGIWEEPWGIRDFVHYGATIANAYFLSTPTVDAAGRFATTLGEVKQAALMQNFPNPFNPETWIPYRLTETTQVSMIIYDVTGHRVRTLDLGTQAPGDYITQQTAAHWDGTNEEGNKVASGIYFYQLSAGNFSALRKMLLLK